MDQNTGTSVGEIVHQSQFVIGQDHEDLFLFGLLHKIVLLTLITDISH